MTSHALANPVICIQGPTACGKSDLAEELCLALAGEVVSADSMQIYKGMDIGTAKVPLEMRRVPYHCIDLVMPDQPYSAALFQADARRSIERIDASGKRPVLCGGTAFYVKVVIDEMDLAPGEQEDNPTRERYMALAEELGPTGLHELLASKDPASAACIHPNNVRRVVRALEMIEEGESYARRKEAFKQVPPYYDRVKIALHVEPAELAERINRRVDAMVAAGLVEEVEALCAAGLRSSLTAPQAIGYKEIVAYLDGACSLETALEQIKTATRRYAKRQRSWLRSDNEVIWIDASGSAAPSVLDRALAIIEGQGER